MLSHVNQGPRWVSLLQNIAGWGEEGYANLVTRSLVWFKKLNNTPSQQNTVQYTIHLNNGVKLLVFPKLYTRCEENL